MSGRLHDKAAVVTGSARGIGATIAALFVEEGARVVGIDRLPRPTDTPVILHLTADITRAEQVSRAVTIALEKLSRIDILINNAGANVFYDPLRLQDAEWEECLAIDLKAAWLVSKAVLPTMLAQSSGSIVNICSVHGHRIIPGCFPYPVAKHGLLGLTRALGLEYARHGIRVNSISPGLILTPQVEAWLQSFPDPQQERRRQEELLPCRRLGSPEEVAHAALFLASDEAPFINAADIVMDGGRSQLYHE